MPVLFILTPLLGIVLLNVIKKSAGRKAAFGFALAISCAQILGSALTMTGWSFLNLENFYTFGLFDNLTVDFTSALVLATIGLIAMISSIVGIRMSKDDRLNFTNVLLVAMIGMNGAVMTADLFTLYIFLEITAVSAFILIAVFRDRNGLGGAFKYLVMSSVATVMLLSGLALIYLRTGDLRFSAVRDFLAASGGHFSFEIIAGVVLFLAGLSVKAGLVPFNGWVPDAYSNAPAPVSVLLAGIVTKVAGVYAVMRLSSGMLASVPWVRTVLLVLGLLSIFVGAFAAIGQNDFKRMLAFSSISQVGYIILGAATGSLLGLAGALLHFFNHAVFKSLLFVNATAVEEQTGTRDLRDLGGLASVMRVTGGTSVVGFLSASGIPPLAGFWSKLLIIIALWSAGYVWIAISALLASVLTLAYFLILQRKVFFGKTAEAYVGLKEAGKHLTVPAFILAGLTIVVGLLMPLFLSYMRSRGLL